MTIQIQIIFYRVVYLLMVAYSVVIKIELLFLSSRSLSSSELLHYLGEELSIGTGFQ